MGDKVDDRQTLSSRVVISQPTVLEGLIRLATRLEQHILQALDVVGRSIRPKLLKDRLLAALHPSSDLRLVNLHKLKDARRGGRRLPRDQICRVSAVLGSGTGGIHRLKVQRLHQPASLPTVQRHQPREEACADAKRCGGGEDGKGSGLGHFARREGGDADKGGRDGRAHHQPVDEPEGSRGVAGWPADEKVAADAVQRKGGGDGDGARCDALGNGDDLCGEDEVGVALRGRGGDGRGVEA